MRFNLRRSWDTLLAASMTVCAHLLREPALQPRATAHGLDLPVVPSRAARRAAWLFLVVAALHAIELLLLAHWLAAATVGALVICLVWQLRRMNRDLPDRPRRLLVTADGRIYVLSVSGVIEQFALHPASVRLGPWMLLLLVREKRRIRLLLGSGNTRPEHLAALRRRLLQAASPADPLLKPPPASRCQADEMSRVSLKVSHSSSLWMKALRKPRPAVG